MNLADAIIQKINQDVEKPLVTATFGDNWKQHTKDSLVDGVPIDVIIDIAWKQGRRAILLERKLREALEIAASRP